MNIYYIQRNFYHFKFKFNPAIIAEIKAIDGRKFNPQTREWYIPVSLLVMKKINDLIKKYNFICDENSSLYGEPLKKIKPSISVEDEKRGIEEIKIELGKLNLGITPRPFQWQGIFYMSIWGNMILGDDCGLGKTPQTIFTAELNNWFPCLVVCPASTNYQWAELWQKANPNRVISVIDTSNKNPNWKADVVIVKWSSMAETDGTKIKYGKEVKNVVPKNIELLSKWKYCVLDEIHFAKNKKSNRSIIINSIAKKSEIVCGLTGTLSLNKMSEVIAPLTLIKQFKELFGGWQPFVERYCNAKKVNDRWDYSGASNLAEFHQILKYNCYLRREKSEVRSDQPEVQESYYHVDITNKSEYGKAEKNFISYLINNVKDIDKIDSACRAEILVQRAHLRKLSVMGKIKAIKQWIDDFLESSNGKLVVSGIHSEPLKLLAKHYGGEILNGEMNSLKKRETIKSFKDSKDRIIFAQMKAVGTGTDGLQHSSSNLLIIEEPDRPADLIQLIARLDRDGQTEPVNANFILCKTTIDESNHISLNNKKKITNAINKGETIQDEDFIEDFVNFYLKK